MTEQNGLERSSATEELRRLLDERGVEWIGTSFSTPAKGHPTNTSLGEEHHEATFIEYDDGNVLRLFDLTPEQAVEATLGRGTCHDTQEDEERFCCSECGSRSHIATEYRKFDEYGNKSEHFLFVDNPRFCPSCGRKVVDA